MKTENRPLSYDLALRPYVIPTACKTLHFNKFIFIPKTVDKFFRIFSARIDKNSMSSGSMRKNYIILKIVVNFYFGIAAGYRKVVYVLTGIVPIIRRNRKCSIPFFLVEKSKALICYVTACSVFIKKVLFAANYRKTGDGSLS